MYIKYARFYTYIYMYVCINCIYYTYIYIYIYVYVYIYTGSSSTPSTPISKVKLAKFSKDEEANVERNILTECIDSSRNIEDIQHVILNKFERKNVIPIKSSTVHELHAVNRENIVNDKQKSLSSSTFSGRSINNSDPQVLKHKNTNSAEKMIEHYSSKEIETTNIEKDLNDTTTDTEMNFIDDSEGKQGKSRKSVECANGGDNSTDKETTDSLNTVSNSTREKITKVKSNADLSEEVIKSSRFVTSKVPEDITDADTKTVDVEKVEEEERVTIYDDDGTSISDIVATQALHESLSKLGKVRPLDTEMEEVQNKRR